MASSPRILVVGSVNMDLVVRCARMPAPGETILGEQFTTSPGGKGANQAVAVARLGGACRMIGRVGDDAFGRELLGHLGRMGVETEAIDPTAELASGVAVIVVDAGGENAIVVASGANWRVSPDDVRRHEADFAAADVVVAQLELPVETVTEAIRLARRHGKPFILDPAPARADLPDELLAVDYLSPNESEAQLLTGLEVGDLAQAEQAGRALQARGARHVVLKLGAAGSLVLGPDGQARHVEPFKIQPVDTTAAGDAFTGALAVALGQGKELLAAARFANAAGALAATQPGAQLAMPSAQAVAKLLAKPS